MVLGNSSRYKRLAALYRFLHVHTTHRATLSTPGPAPTARALIQPALSQAAPGAQRQPWQHTQTRATTSDTASSAESAESALLLDRTISTSSVLQTVRECRQKHPQCVLLVRVGDFYELYMDQADSVGGHILGLQVVDKKFRNGSVRFTGFPARSLLRYLEILVSRHGMSVALCEQFQEPMRRSFTRRVTRVVTPGTLIDDQCVATTRVHNYILCVAPVDAAHAERAAFGSAAFDPSSVELPEPVAFDLGLAWLDVATGDFMTGTASSDTLSADLARIQPSEILVDETNATLRRLLAKAQAEAPAGRPPITPVPGVSFRLVESAEGLLAAAELATGELAAARALLNYVQATQLGLLPPLQPPRQYRPEGHVRMSAATIQALELLRPLHAGSAPGSSPAAASLLGELDSTRTSAGGRLLAKRLAAPSTDAAIVEARLDLVELFAVSQRIRARVAAHLDGIGDIERAVNKLSLNCGGPHDLLEIARTLREVARIKALLRAHLDAPPRPPARKSAARRPPAIADSGRRAEILAAVGRKEQAMVALDALAVDIERKIRADADRDVRVFGFLKPNCSSTVTQLHRDLRLKDAERQAMQEHWQRQYTCASLKLDTASHLGHFIEVSKRDSEKLQANAEFRMIQSLKSKVRFENQRWTYLLSEIDMLRTRVQAEEMRVFEELRDEVLRASFVIRTNSKVLADLDCSICMAELASARQYVRPRFVGPMESHVVTNGRHPVVESQLLDSNRQYVSNDCRFEADTRVLLLTGPNMGGKSTYLRQIALVSIMAQIGSFVPADLAQLHILDAIYSRIGAHDNLALDQSTFMVEMTEAAEILRHATPRSLVILDEIGRGTSTADGVSIAYATLKYLHDVVQCKAVFATHYHELIPHVVPTLKNLVPLHTAIYEDNEGGFAFLHKVREGVCTKSHAFYVAQIAGIPRAVLDTAREFAASHFGTNGRE
ncbi:MutS protein 1 [Kickxella alabastrina]|nr:MutS protein 1 [Kickxella alabastrina]